MKMIVKDCLKLRIRSEIEKIVILTMLLKCKQFELSVYEKQNV